MSEFERRLLRIIKIVVVLGVLWIMGVERIAIATMLPAALLGWWGALALLVVAALAWMYWTGSKELKQRQTKLQENRKLVGKRIDGGKIVNVDESNPYWVICRWDDDGSGSYLDADKVRRDLERAKAAKKAAKAA